MPASLVLTLIGPDRPGLVESLSRTIAAHEGNWLESRMARLAGRFSGILLVSVPEANVEKLTEALRGLEAQGLKLLIETSGAEESFQGWRVLALEMVGHDRPGIIRDISHALASRGINIDELETRVSDGSWSGESMFHAQARLRVPPDVPIQELRELLEGLGNELMVDITLEGAG